MTASDDVNAVVGHCASAFLKLTTNITGVSDLNDAMCGHLNRTGQMCRSCSEGHAPTVYSYSLACDESSGLQVQLVEIYRHCTIAIDSVFTYQR